MSAAEVVVADGETGLLVPPGDVEAMTSALATLMRDPERAARMAKRARARVAAEFSIETEAARIAALYRQTRRASAPNGR